MVRLNATRRIGAGLAAAAAALGLMLPQAALAQGVPLKDAPLAAGSSTAFRSGSRCRRFPRLRPNGPVEWLAPQISCAARSCSPMKSSGSSCASPRRTGAPGKPGLYFVCQRQTVRVFRGLDAKPPMPLVPQDRIGDPIPGPTLRARLGDIVQLTFVNNINPGRFPIRSIRQKTRRSCRRASRQQPAVIPARRVTRPPAGTPTPTASTGRAPATSISTARIPIRTVRAITCFSRCARRQS